MTRIRVVLVDAFAVAAGIVLGLIYDRLDKESEQ